MSGNPYQDEQWYSNGQAPPYQGPMRRQPPNQGQSYQHGQSPFPSTYPYPIYTAPHPSQLQNTYQQQQTPYQQPGYTTQRPIAPSQARSRKSKSKSRTPELQDVDRAYRHVDNLLKPFEEDKQLVMDLTTYSIIKTAMSGLPKNSQTEGYKRDLKSIYDFPRNLAKTKVARAMDPKQHTNREGYEAWLRWAYDNRLTPSGKSVKNMLKDFDAVHPRGASQELESMQKQPSRKTGKKASNTRRN